MNYLVLLFSALLSINSSSLQSEFPRTSIQTRFEQKSTSGQPLLIHLLVPLCDNDNQGIVPVNKTLGNGLDAKNNLYWGALYGVKTHFS